LGSIVRIDFHPEATQELADAAEWYLNRSPRAACDFAVEIKRALDKIRDDPRRFATIGTGFRACSVERFPFQVVFRTDPHRIFVIAVAHAKRRPGYWQSRGNPGP
jgi:plasmid stabilization system protein ParE